MCAQSNTRLQAVLLDWAGTTVDYGSRAPVQAFMEVFRLQGVTITAEEARGPMGRAKRDHLAAIAALPRVSAAWRDAQGRFPDESDIDRMYDGFLPLQKQILAQHVDVIPGVPEAIAECRRRGLKIGSTTGYSRELMKIVIPAARSGGYEADVIVCADDVPAGRPAPWMNFHAAEALGVYPMRTVIVVDDTPVGIHGGRNAGAWTVAVAKTGNALGCSQAELSALPAGELQHRLRAIGDQFLAEGADFVIDSVAELPTIVDMIEQRLEESVKPYHS